MILREHAGSHRKFAQFMNGSMLMLGRQDGMIDGLNAKDYFMAMGLTHYHDLDLDGGNISLSLDDDLHPLGAQFEAVYNLGTIEHVWDAHRAWCNALRMVKVDGHLLIHAPVGGYEGHGIHITNVQYLERFLTLNEAVCRSRWFTRQDGLPSNGPERGAGNIIYWAAWQKTAHLAELADYQRPQQVFHQGVVHA